MATREQIKFEELKKLMEVMMQQLKEDKQDLNQKLDQQKMGFGQKFNQQKLDLIRKNLFFYLFLSKICVGLVRYRTVFYYIHSFLLCCSSFFLFNSS